MNAGDLLVEGDESQHGFKRNKLFAFVNYLGAYKNGAFFLQEKMERLQREVETELGVKLPKIVYVNEEKFKKMQEEAYRN